MSKILNSRDEWRKKATERATELREFRKTQKRHLEKIAELKRQNCQLEQCVEKNFVAANEPVITASDSNNITVEKNASNVVNIEEAQQTRILCVLLVLEAVVSYRSVPRILELFIKKTHLNLPWIPNFTSVINWSLRVGLGLLYQVNPILEPWIAIIDHSIDIGTKKALVVLRVKMDTLLRYGSAIRLENCECIGVRVCETVNADTVCADLTEIFAMSGTPTGILKDCDATLANGEKNAQHVCSERLCKKDSVLDKLRTVFPNFSQMKGFIEHFSLITKIVAEVMEILKNKGLNKITYRQCYELSKTLPKNSKVKKRLQTWLKKHLKIQKELTELPLLVISDIIESLFGNYKYIIERSPQADMNRSILLIPALCGRREETIIDQALNKASQVDLEEWEKGLIRISREDTSIRTDSPSVEYKN